MDQSVENKTEIKDKIINFFSANKVKIFIFGFILVTALTSFIFFKLNNEKKNIEVIKNICSILEDLAPLKKSSSNIPNYESLITFVNDRPGHDMRYSIDTSKIKKDLGWEPRETFESGILKTIKWFLENKHWCQNIKDGSYLLKR